jgi:hypothetical protein
MSYQSGLFDRLLCVRWTADPMAADVDRLEAEVLAASRRLGPIVVIAVQYTLAPPSAEVRARFQALMKNVLDAIELAVLVIDGDGVGPMLVRTVIRGTLIATGYRDRARIAGDVEEAIRLAAPAVGTTSHELKSKLRESCLFPKRAAGA